LEKDVNLKVALKLRDLLEAEGAVVYMTRTEDVYVSISQRWEMANSWGVDRFISIHHNGHSSSTVNGTETLISIYASEESKELANSVQAELVGELGLPNRGVKMVDYCGVLNNTSMPAILTEASFITNPDEENRLRDDSYLEREARAILRGIHMPSRISFILPKQYAVSSRELEVSIQALGSEDIDRIDLLVDGTLITTLYQTPYQCRLDLSGWEDGTYLLSAVARYRDGNSSSVQRDVIVADAARSWYFAEGTTRKGFEEWLTLLNPNPVDVEVEVVYVFDGGGSRSKTYLVGAESRLSVDVNEEVGAGKDVSMIIDASLPVMAERPMYFLYRDRWAGGHVSTGVNRPACEWYFAEGYTGEGFEEWICLLNPGDASVEATLRYYSQQGLIKEESITLQPWSRETVNVNEAVGPGKEVSVRVQGSGPLVAERPMYFLYRDRWAGGHVSTGVNRPACEWYFAEGYTGEGFEEWICLLNPAEEENKVTVTFQTSEGVELVHEVTLPPGSRRTVDVNEEVGEDLQLSAEVRGEKPLVAERPVYHDYHAWCQGGDVGGGVTAPSRHWYFAEGYTGAGFEDWLCIQNPQDGEVEVSVRFHFESGEVLEESVAVPARSRFTIYVNSMVPYQEGVAFSVHAAGDVVVERPIYFRYRDKWCGGHVSSGYAPGIR
jgi:hypothetical protein